MSEHTTIEGIAQAVFMAEHAGTTGFSHTLRVQGEAMSHNQTTELDIYGKHAYRHTDENTPRRTN